MAFSSTREESALKSVPNTGEPEGDYLKYLPLYRAAVRGDWETASRIFQQDEGAVTAIINSFKQTALHVATEAGKNIHFLEELVKLMPEEALLWQDNKGNTPLALAAMIGDTKAATILVNQNQELLYVRDFNNNLPVNFASLSTQRQTLSYLLNAVSNNIESHPHPFQEPEDVCILVNVIRCGYFDIALDLVEKYPHLATLSVPGHPVPLEAVANIPSAFRRGCKLKYWESLVYDGIPLSLLEYDPNKKEGDVENPTRNSDHVLSQTNSFMWQELQIMIWKTIIYLAPPLKQIRDKKLMHNHALQLLKLIRKEIEALNNPMHHLTRARPALIRAASIDNPEVIEEIVEIFPNAIWTVNNRQDRRFLFHMAVLNRCENTFNLAYQMGGSKPRVMNTKDNHKNTILHLAGRLANPQKLNLVSGAALQMQRELQWFKEVERWVTQNAKDRPNDDGDTPQMIFTEAHKDLVIDGEKWMRETANSCAIVASLIVTIVFAAAITLPGGNNENDGQPVLFKRKAFLIFAISDAISFFSSTTSLLMFLAILTSRYAEIDFLYALPKKLIIGLVTLFLSITFMVVAFCCAFYLVFGRGENWVLVGVAILASLPITSFVFLQFPLLVNVIYSTYGPGIFGKKSDRPFG